MFFLMYEKTENDYFSRSSSVVATITAEHLQQPLLFSRKSSEHKAQIITAALGNGFALLGDRVGNTQAAENKHSTKLWRGRGIERESERGQTSAE